MTVRDRRGSSATGWRTRDGAGLAAPRWAERPRLPMQTDCDHRVMAVGVIAVSVLLFLCMILGAFGLLPV